MDVPLVTRLAGMEDYDAVMSISHNIYSGLDYLPASYRILLQNHSCVMFISELNGKPVSFGLNLLMENGTLLLAMAARVDPAYKKTGSFKRHSVNARAYMKQNYPKISRRCFAALDSEIHRRHLQDKSLNFSLVLKQPVLFYYGKTDDARRLSEHLVGQAKSTHVKTFELGLSESLHVLSDQNNIKKLFPVTYFLATSLWIPFRVTRGNINWLAKNATIMASLTENGDCLCISHSTTIQVPAGSRVCIYLHDPDMKNFPAHILKHVYKASQIIKSPHMTIDLHFAGTLTVDRKHVDQLMSDVSLNVQESYPHSDVILVMEHLQNQPVSKM